MDSWPGNRASAAGPIRVAKLLATERASVVVEEGRRPVRGYMSLPASQYSVLDAELVERVGDNVFVCTLTTIRVFGAVLKPVLTALVDVQADGSGCCIKVIDAKVTIDRRACSWLLFWADAHPPHKAPRSLRPQITGTKAIEDYAANFKSAALLLLPVLRAQFAPCTSEPRPLP